MKKIAWALLLLGVTALATRFLLLRARYPGKATLKLSAESCDASLWKHVYSPERLRVLEPCTAVAGRVVSVHPQSDGDVHIALDPDQTSVLNLVNRFHGRSHLIVEAVCNHAPPLEAERAACAGFVQRLSLPKPGDRVRVTGSYVTDRDNGWNEIHPVSRIDILP